MAFLAYETKSIRSTTSQERYKELPRTRETAEDLCVHHGDVFRAYSVECDDQPGASLEFSTGMGRTLTYLFGIPSTTWGLGPRDSSKEYLISQAPEFVTLSEGQK